MEMYQQEVSAGEFKRWCGSNCTIDSVLKDIAEGAKHHMIDGVVEGIMMGGVTNGALNGVAKGIAEGVTDDAINSVGRRC